MTQSSHSQKGTLILTEGRSGSNWLGSLSNGTKVLGNSGEWFARWSLGSKFGNLTADQIIETTIDKASTENGYFCVKLFPAHVHYFNITFGVDLIQELMKRYDCNLIVLHRGDRLRQAISFARGLQTESWTSRNAAKKEAEYDFGMVARCYFLINQSYEYWNSYVSLRDLDVTKFEYEGLIDNPQPYVSSIANHAQVETAEIAPSPLKIQRDTTTEDWIEKFKADLSTKGVVGHSDAHRPYHITLSNLLRFLRKKPMKPYPFTY